MVPLGSRPMGIQPDDSTWKNLAASLLGTHRVGLREVHDSAAPQPDRARRVPRTIDHILVDAGAVPAADDTAWSVHSIPNLGPPATRIRNVLPVRLSLSSGIQQFPS